MRNSGSVTANIPASDLSRARAFYADLGFAEEEVRLTRAIQDAAATDRIQPQ